MDGREHDPTPADLLMEVMEDFGETEPVDVLVVYTNENEELVMKSNCRRTTLVGLLECAKNAALNFSGEES